MRPIAPIWSRLIVTHAAFNGEGGGGSLRGVCRSKRAELRNYALIILKSSVNVISVRCYTSSDIYDELFKEDEIGDECSTNVSLKMLQHGMKGSSACLVAFVKQNQTRSVLRQRRRRHVRGHSLWAKFCILRFSL
jgi:hypothetical protein